MQMISLNLKTKQNISDENLLDKFLPQDVLGVIFEKVVNQNDAVRAISSILLTCQNWKRVLEKNPCISLVQALFQIKKGPQSAITCLQECRITEQKSHFTPQELKLIDRASCGKRFEKLLMCQSELFQVNSLFLSLLDRYPWDPEFCKNSDNKNIQLVAEEQLNILNALVSGTDDQRLAVIQHEFFEKLYYSGRSAAWKQVKRSVIFTLKAFPSFNDKPIFIKVARCFGSSIFDINENLKKDREIVLAAIQYYGYALKYADESLKKDREIVLAAVKQQGYALKYADESLKKDREIVLAAVKQQGYALKYADSTFKKDREIVLIAIQQTSEALKYADQTLKKDREFILTAVQQNGWAFQFADKSLKNDQEFILRCLAAVKKEIL